MSENGEAKDFWVMGIVSHRDQKPYVQLHSTEGIIAQLGMSEVRQIAMDMLVMASRTEMDAMLFRFLMESSSNEEKAETVAGAMMVHFREYRAEYDRELAERPPDQEGGLPPRQL